MSCDRDVFILKHDNVIIKKLKTNTFVCFYFILRSNILDKLQFFKFYLLAEFPIHIHPLAHQCNLRLSLFSLLKRFFGLINFSFVRLKEKQAGIFQTIQNNLQPKSISLRLSATTNEAIACTGNVPVYSINILQ